MAQIALLQSKIKELEASIRVAEAAAKTTEITVNAWSNPILTGEQTIMRPRLDLQPLIIAYPGLERDESLFTSFGFEFEGVASEPGQSELLKVSGPSAASRYSLDGGCHVFSLDS